MVLHAYRRKNQGEGVRHLRTEGVRCGGMVVRLSEDGVIEVECDYGRNLREGVSR